MYAKMINVMIEMMKLLRGVRQMLSINFLQEKTYINQSLKQCPWKYKQCHGKLA